MSQAQIYPSRVATEEYPSVRILKYLATIWLIDRYNQTTPSGQVFYPVEE